MASVGQRYRKDAHDLVKASDRCQRFANVQTQPREPMPLVTTPWPFAQWGIDIMEPFSPGKKQVRFFIVVIDYFTKWVEAQLLAKITELKSETLSGRILFVGLGFLTQ